MAARKKATRKKATRGKTGGLGAALGRLDLPPTLREYAKQVQGRLDGLEQEISRASTDVRRRAARLLREASHQLGRLEVKGEAGWRRLTSPYRRQLVDLLKRLEKALAPGKTRSRRPSATRKATRRVTRAMRETAAVIDESPPSGS